MWLDDPSLAAVFLLNREKVRFTHLATGSIDQKSLRDQSRVLLNVISSLQMSVLFFSGPR